MLQVGKKRGNCRNAAHSEMEMVFLEKFLCYIPNKNNFSRSDFLRALKRERKQATESTGRFYLQKLLDSGEIVRVGRNAYCVDNGEVKKYDYEYSEFSNELANRIQGEYPLVDFRIFELVQLNEFVNHQIAHNVVFLSVESDLGDFIFDSIRNDYAGHILINPTVDVFHQYWSDNMVVIEKMITESPKGNGEVWHTGLEKMLVDLVADKLLLSCIGQGEYDGIFTQALQDFFIDESQMFRYARRRNATKKIMTYIDKSLLRTV